MAGHRSRPASFPWDSVLVVTFTLCSVFMPDTEFHSDLSGLWFPLGTAFAETPLLGLQQVYLF